MKSQTILIQAISDLIPIIEIAYVETIIRTYPFSAPNILFKNNIKNIITIFDTTHFNTNLFFMSLFF